MTPEWGLPSVVEWTKCWYDEPNEEARGKIDILIVTNEVESMTLIPDRHVKILRNDVPERYIIPVGWSRYTVTIIWFQQYYLDNDGSA